MGYRPTNPGWGAAATYAKKKPLTPGGVAPEQAGATNPAPQRANIVPQNNRVIPGAGVYGQRQANAELAWQQAQQAAEAKKNSMYHQYGLTNTGQVDPLNQYGQYQQMLQMQGAGLDASRDNAFERGLGGGPGLGNQGERTLRYANAVQGLGFQGSVNQIATDYGLSMGEADAIRRNAMTDALQQSLSDSWGDWTPPDMAGGQSAGSADKAPTTAIKTPIYNRAWGPPPSKAMKKIIASIPKVKSLPKPKSKHLTPGGSAAQMRAMMRAQAALKKKKRR